jgi:GDP-L-fucose synthase
MQVSPSMRIFVAGHQGLVGSAVLRLLQAQGWTNIITRRRAELDLLDQAAVRAFFTAEKPEIVVMAAARVGGIHANSSYPARFIRENLVLQDNVIHSAYESGVSKLLFLGSSCIYPKLAPQPIKEDALLTGALEPTNEWYAVAKIAGLKMCQAYRREYGFNAISLMPTNLYGPGDNFDPENSHVLPALMRRFHEAKLRCDKSVTIWGSGSPRREFLHVDDLASAVLFALQSYDEEPIVNVGCGEEVTIRELAELIMSVIGYSGELVCDRTKPDGTPRKLLDIQKLTEIGWKPRISLKDGITETYRWFAEHFADARL